MSAPQAPASRRKHTTSACVSCRESKIKCDGAFPACSSCKAKGRQCEYHAADDRRRLSHRMVAELLAERVHELSQFIRQNSLEPPAMDEDKHASLTKVLAHVRLSNTLTGKDGFVKRQAPPLFDDVGAELEPPALGPADNARPAPDSQFDIPVCAGADSTISSNDGRLSFGRRPTGSVSHEMTIQQDGNGMFSFADHHQEPQGSAPAESPYPRWGWAELELPRMDMPSETVGGFDSLNAMMNDGSHATQQESLGEANDNNSDTESAKGLVNQLSDRIGSLRIGAGGQVRYYGPTSNFNLVDMGAPDNLTVHRSVRHHGPEYLDRLDMGKKVPVDLEDHLINLYFTWQDPAFHVVKRGMYDKAKMLWRDEQADTPYFSEALHNALCSLGAAFEARHYPTFTTFPKSLADFFADRAKTLLEIELDSPCVATVQALIVLSSHDIGCKRDSRGWLYSGMATRLAFHLALHLDMTSYVSSNAISQAEADLRRDVFWAAYTVDHVWSLHLGQAFRINMETVTLGHPDPDKSVDAVGQWTPYVSSRHPEEQASQPDHTVELHRQRVLLCEIMAPLGFALYGDLGMSSKALHELNITTVSKLFSWKLNLPTVLQVDTDKHNTPYLPHVLLLHMLYHQNIIYSHRPWMSRQDTSTQHHLSEGHNPEHARAMCIDAAVSIAKILQIYEERYGLKRINIQAVGITCSAALLLVFAVVIKYTSRPAEGPRSSTANAPMTHSGLDPSSLAMHLGTCFRALDDFGGAWETAKQSRDFLTLLQRRWERQARKLRDGRDSQSPGSALNGSDYAPNKRPRTGEKERSAEPMFLRPWPGTLPRPDAVDGDMEVDLDWIFMRGGEPMLGADFT